MAVGTAKIEISDQLQTTFSNTTNDRLDKERIVRTTQAIKSIKDVENQNKRSAHTSDFSLL